LLLVEDDVEVAEMMTFTLAAEGHEVGVAGDAETAMREFKLARPEAVVLDVSLPGKSGLDLCMQIRAISRVPVLFVTARGLLQDKVRGFSVGGDDYIVKPFLPTELAIRVDALLRRSTYGPPPTGVIRTGDLEVDAEVGVVRLRGKLVKLSPMEHDILVALASTLGDPWSAERLARRLGLRVDTPAQAAELIYVKINRMRRKIEDNPHQPRHILSQRHAGYYLAAQPQEIPPDASSGGDNSVTG